MRLAWRQVNLEWASSVGLAFAIFLTLLPAGLLVVESSEDQPGAHVFTLTVRLVVVMLMVLVVFLVGVLSNWYVQLRLRDLTLLRGRGWSRMRVRLLVLTQLLMLATTAVGVDFVGLLAVVWRPDRRIGVGPALPAGSELQVIMVVAWLPLLAAAGWLIGLVWWVSRQDVTRLVHPEANKACLVTWRGADLDGLLALPAVGLLLLRRSIRTPGWGTSAALDDFIGLLLSLGALVLLLMVTSYLMSLTAEALLRRRADVEGTLSRWQLHRWWQRHTDAGFLIILAFSASTLTAVALAHEGLDNSPLDSSSQQQSAAISLGVGFAASTVVGLMAYGLVFVSACRSRVDDYRALLVDGLPVDTLRRSLRLEQAVVLAMSLLAGIGLGWILLWANAPALGLETKGGAVVSFLSPQAALVGVVSTITTGFLAATAVAWYIRRSAVGFGLLE